MAHLQDLVDDFSFVFPPVTVEDEDDEREASYEEDGGEGGQHDLVEDCEVRDLGKRVVHDEEEGDCRQKQGECLVESCFELLGPLEEGEG